jgi:hypothetical protein
VPGGGRTVDTPAAVMAPNGGLYLVVRGTDDRVYFNYRDGSGWQGWRLVAAGRTENDGVTDLYTYSAPAVTWNSFYGTAEIYVRADNDRIYMDSNPNYWWNFGPYFGEVYGGGTTYSGPAAASGGNQVRVFARGTDSGNQIWMNWKWASGHYQGWYEALPNGATPDSPAAASDANGNYYVAVRGTNNLIYSFRGTWTQVGNGSTYSQPAIGYTPHGLCIFVRGTNNLIYHNCR